MPIYVNGGEAGKLYMMSDPPLQIGKVYRKDAGGSSVIYSGEEVLYDGGMVVPFENYGYVSNSSYLYTERTDNGTNLFAKVRYNLGGNDFYNGYAGWRTQRVVDLSQYSTITIKARVQNYWSSYNGVRVEFWDENNTSVGTINIMQDTQTTLDSEWTLDLSAFNGACKVGVTAWQTYSNGRGAEFNLYKMILA